MRQDVYLKQRRWQLETTSLEDRANHMVADLKPISSDEKNKPNMSWVNDFTLTKEEANMIAEPKWVYPNLIIQSHMMVFPAPPNGGKTTLFIWIAGKIAKDYQVYYVNADIASADAK